MGRTEDREPLLQIRDVTKRFGALIANDRINMNIYRGEIHAVLGEKGGQEHAHEDAFMALFFRWRGSGI